MEMFLFYPGYNETHEIGVALIVKVKQKKKNGLVLQMIG